MIFIIVIINLNCLQFNQAYQVGLVGLAEVGDELVAEVVALLETGGEAEAEAEAVELARLQEKQSIGGGVSQSITTRVFLPACQKMWIICAMGRKLEKRQALHTFKGLLCSRAGCGDHTSTSLNMDMASSSQRGELFKKTLTTAARMEISLSLVGSLKIGISRVIMEQGVEHMELEVERWRLLDGRRHGTQQKRDGLKIYLLTSGAGTSTLGSGSKV